MRFLFILFFATVCLTSIAQTKYNIKKVNAFYTVRMPGNIPVDDNGHPLRHYPDTAHVIYIETFKAAPVWKRAWINGKAFSVSLINTSSTAIEVGAINENGKMIKLIPQKGNKIAQLELSSSSQPTKQPKKTRKNEILLQGIFNKQTIYITICCETKLYSPPSV
jgi:hypothetical protein